MVAKNPMQMPMGSQSPMGGPPAPGGPSMMAGRPPTQGGGSSPEQVRAAIMTVLQRAKALAETNGLDFASMVSELGGGGSSAPPPPPAMA